MEDAVILSAVRTPIGRYGGSLKDVRPDDLAALAMSNPERFLFGFMQGNPFRAATFE